MGAANGPADGESGRVVWVTGAGSGMGRAAAVHAAALQYVRKVSGFNTPSKVNEAVFQAAVDEIAAASGKLLSALETTAPAKDRAEEEANAHARTAQRFPK